MKKQIIISLLGLSMLANSGEFYHTGGEKIELTELEVSQAVGSRVLNSRTKYYKTATGKTIGVRDDILVECEADKDCKEVLSKYETTDISQLTDSLYIVKISSDKNVFKFAQKLYSDSDIKVAHPNLRKTKSRR